MTALLAAADPELHRQYSAGSYALGIAEFIGIAALVLTVLGVIWHRYATHLIASHVRPALDNGDKQILRAVQESEDAHARRPQQHASVPRQLERNHR